MFHLRIGRIVVVVAVLGALIWAVTARAIHRVENASSGPRPAPAGSNFVGSVVATPGGLLGAGVRQQRGGQLAGHIYRPGADGTWASIANLPHNLVPDGIATARGTLVVAGSGAHPVWTASRATGPWRAAPVAPMDVVTAVFGDKNGVVVAGWTNTATGLRSTVVASVDGVRWTEAPFRGDTRVQQAVAGPGGVVLYGTSYAGSIRTPVAFTANGPTWAPIPLVVPHAAREVWFDAVGRGPDGVVAAVHDGAQNALWASSDGITWTEIIDLPPAVGSTRFTAVAADPVQGWLVAGTRLDPNGEHRVAWASATGTTWSTAHIGGHHPYGGWMGATITNGRVMLIGSEWRGSTVEPVSTPLG